MCRLLCNGIGLPQPDVKDFKLVGRNIVLEEELFNGGKKEH